MHMDAIARALAVDAVEFRLRHLKDERMRAVLTAAAERYRVERRRSPADTGAGDTSRRCPVTRHCVRHGEGQLRRHRRAGFDDA